MRKNGYGFTLMELMIAVAIVGILTAIALPNYRQYVVRNNRAAVQAEMLQIASALERYKTMQLTYSGATILMLYGGIVYPKTGTALYTLGLSPSANLTSTTLTTTWTISATPNSSSIQKGDGVLKLDNLGRRCWNKSSDTLSATNCDLSSSSQAWSVK